MTYEERLHYLKLHSLKGRRLRGDLIQTYKIFNNVDDIPTDLLFTTNTNPTRNSQGKIFLQHSNIKIRKHYFSNRIAPFWNNLTPELKFAKSTNDFKNSLDCMPKFIQLFSEYD